MIFMPADTPEAMLQVPAGPGGINLSTTIAALERAWPRPHWVISRTANG